MTTCISYKAEDGLATILLQAAEGKPPTMDGEVLKQLEKCVARARQENPRVVFVRSNSERFFCVGANINVLKDTDEKSIVPWVMEGHRVLNVLEDLPMPVVAVVGGYAMGGGLELAMACDLIFATDKAQFAQSEASLGFIPGWGGSRRLAGRIGASKAKLLFYSGQMIDGAKAAELGLVDLAVDPSQLEEEIRSFAESILAKSRTAISQFKLILNDQERRARDENAAVEAFGSIASLQDPDTKQRLNNFLAKKKSK